MSISIQPSELSKKLIEEVKSQFGTIPPHFEIFAVVNPERFKIFLDEIVYLSNHKSIVPDLFAFLRLYTAKREEFSYCQLFNTKLLLSKGYTKDEVEKSISDIEAIPLDDRHKALAKNAVKAIFSPQTFNDKEIESLLSLGWSHSDVYDAVDHVAYLLRYGRVIQVFLKNYLLE